MKTAAQVLVFPAWRDNPFLNLLGLAPRAAGYRFLEATTHRSLLRQLTRLTSGDVLHVHWTQVIAQQEPTELDARARIDELATALSTARRHGVRIVWTVHNRLPHELAYREVEIELYRLIADRADVVHVMAPATPDLIAEVVRIDPSKIRPIPHPSYDGVYDTDMDRATARASFELEPHDRAVLFLGQIRPYKGVDALVSAAGMARPADHRIVLLLAGAVKEMSEDDFMNGIPEGLRTVTSFGFVPDGDLARWFGAADVAVFPYRAILNSGSVHLAATFRVPVVLPDEPHLRVQFGDQPWVAFFDTSRPAESIAELLGDDRLFSRVTREDFERFSTPISPWRVSREYRALLDELSADAMDEGHGPAPR